jgi:GNAT superfamily N-acetyltransferase
VTARRARPATRATRIVLERSNPGAVARELWKGLVEFNRASVGPLRYSRKVITARGANGRLLGGLILESYLRESYVELLWLRASERGARLGSRLLREAERLARGRGSVLVHLNTYSFQAAGFYEKQGYRRFGAMSGSPRGGSRYFYVKRLRGAEAGDMTRPSAAMTSAAPTSMPPVIASSRSSQPQTMPSTGTARPTVRVRVGPMSRTSVKKGR